MGAARERRVPGQGDDVVMGDGDPFRRTGRARCVADIAELTARHVYAGSTARLVQQRRVTRLHDAQPVVRRHVPVGQQQPCAGLFEDLDGARVRRGRVESDVRTARLQHGEQGDEETTGAGYEDGDPFLALDAQAQEPVGELAGAAVQLGVGEGAFTLYDGLGVRRRGDPGREQVGDAGPVARRGGTGEGRLLAGQGRDDASDDGARCAHGLRETFQEVDEPSVVGGEFGFRVLLGAGVEVDADSVAVGAVVDVDGEVLDRSRGQVVTGRREGSEPQLRSERHDVDDRPEEPPPALRPVQLPAQLLAPVPLVGEQLPGGGGGFAYEVGGEGVGAYGDAQREDIGRHARCGEFGRGGAGGDGETEDDLLGAGHRVQVRGGRREDDPGPAGAGQVGGGVDEFTGDVTRTAQEASTDTGRPGREAHRVGPVGEGPVPVRAVRLGVVRVIGGEQRPERRVRNADGLNARHQSRVRRSHPPRDQRTAEPVHGDVVIRLVPDPVLVPRPQQRVPEQGPLLQIERHGEVPFHPLPSGLDPVDLHDRHGPRKLRLDQQPHALAVFDEA
ncbi:hypothetical protein Saa2_06397 [Streptomyces acidiscabies]|nr:hypothetical protein Saa2_06397 [Streptomyces acidiscabies]